MDGTTLSECGDTNLWSIIRKRIPTSGANSGPSATSTSLRKGKKGLSFLLGAFEEGGGVVGGKGGDGVGGGKRVP